MGCFDNDGDFDVAIQNNVNQNNQFFENNGDGTFTQKFNAITTHTSSSSAWGDFDNDGFIDFVQVGSYPERKTYLYRNNGDKSFKDVSDEQGITNTNYSWGVAWSDYDKDGFLDFFIANSNLGPSFLTNDILYHNTPNGNGWINIKLKGTNSNHSAIGAMVKIYANGKWQFRTVQSKTGNNSENSLHVHFGIGQAEKIDNIQVMWPNQGYQEILNQEKNNFIEITEIDFPKAPTMLTTSISLPGEVKLNWTDNSNNETGFRIERSKGDTNNFSLIATVPEGANSFIDNSLQNGTYFYRVASAISGGFSLYSNISTGVNLVTGLEYQKEDEILIYPNPVSDNLLISNKNFGGGIIKIVDTNGRIVYDGKLNAINEVVSFSDFAPGIYILFMDNRRIKILKK